MKILIFFILSNFAEATNCPTELNKSHLLGKVSGPTKFYTPVRENCTDELLHIFSNCIEDTGSKKTLFFGSREKHSVEQSQSDCPNGFATDAKSGFLRFQLQNGKPVCLDSCESVAIGKFFRDQEKFGTRKALNVGDTIYIPELKGLQCGEKLHEGCVKVSQFIEYTTAPVIDLYSGTCAGSINRGSCAGSKDQKLPQKISIYKVNTDSNASVSENQLSSEVQSYLLSY